MFNRNILLLQILEQINDALITVQKRFEPIVSVNDFTNTPEGKEKLDGICMQLIAIGESLKKVDKLTDKKLLKKFPHIDWSGAKGVRDIIAHHYFDVDAEDIFEICDQHVQPMQKTIIEIIKHIS